MSGSDEGVVLSDRPREHHAAQERKRIPAAPSAVGVISLLAVEGGLHPLVTDKLGSAVGTWVYRHSSTATRPL
jgi:hypothetical protein